MAHRHSILVLTLAAISADVAPVGGHAGDRVFAIPYLSEETLALLDQDDGSVEDWVDAVGPPTFTPLDFELASESTVGRRFDISYDQLTPSNFDFRIWMGWSQEGRIHVAGQFVDDSYINEYEPVDFRTRKLNGVFSSFDSISLFVDGDHTGGEYRFLASHGELENALKTNMQAQHFEAIARVPGGPMISLNSTTAGAIGFDELDIEELDWMVQLPFAQGGGGVFSENPTIWITEFFVTCFDRLHHFDPDEVSCLSLKREESSGLTLEFWIMTSNPEGLRHSTT